MKKNIFITDVLGVVGAAMAKSFRDNGDYVYGVDKSEDFHGNCDRFFRFDMDQFVKDAPYRIRFTQIFEELVPKLDVLIHISAICKPDRLGNIKLEDWQESLNVTLTGPMLLSKLFLSKLEESAGCIINVINVDRLPIQPFLVSYHTAQTALLGLTNALAVDLAGKVRVNAISISNKYDGSIAVHHEATAFSTDNPKNILNHLRVDNAQAVAGLALFLASDTHGHLHGVNLPVGL